MSTAEQGPQDECDVVADALEATAFEGSVPTGSLARHLASCKRCAERWRHEVALYSVPRDLKRRVLEMVARESKAESTGAGSLMERFRAYFGRILGRPRERPEPSRSPENADSTKAGTRDYHILERLQGGDVDGAAREALRRYGLVAQHYLRTVLHDDDLERDAFYGIAQELWGSLPSFDSRS